MKRFFDALMIVCFLIALASIVLFAVVIDQPGARYFWPMVFAVILGLIARRFGTRH